MKIAICEDDIKTQSLLESYLEEYPADLEWKIFSSGEELLAHIKEDKDYFSLYFMDISLAGNRRDPDMRPNPEKRSESPDRFCDRLQRICLRSISGTALPLSDQASEKRSFFKSPEGSRRLSRLHDRRLTFRIRQTMYEIPRG